MDKYEEIANSILARVHEERGRHSDDARMIVKALREAAADAYDDAANVCGGPVWGTAKYSPAAIRFINEAHALRTQEPNGK